MRWGKKSNTVWRQSNHARKEDQAGREKRAKIIVTIGTPLAASSHRTHVSRTQGHGHTYPVNRRGTTQHLHTQSNKTRQRCGHNDKHGAPPVHRHRCRSSGKQSVRVGVGGSGGGGGGCVCECYKERVPNAWHRRGTQQTGNTDNQLKRPSTGTPHRPRTRHCRKGCTGIQTHNTSRHSNRARLPTHDYLRPTGSSPDALSQRSPL